MNRPGGDPAAGLFGSLRQLLATLLEIGQGRLDLFNAEFEREKLRIFEGLIWSIVAAMFIGLGLLLLTALLVLLAPDSVRPFVLGLLALGCLAAGGWLLQHARQRLASTGGPLPATLAELERDRAGLLPPD